MGNKAGMFLWHRKASNGGEEVHPKRIKKLIHISRSALITQILSRSEGKKLISLLGSRAANRKF